MYQGDRLKLLEPRDETFYNFTKSALKTFYELFRIEQILAQILKILQKRKERVSFLMNKTEIGVDKFPTI